MESVSYIVSLQNRTTFELTEKEGMSLCDKLNSDYDKGEFITLEDENKEGISIKLSSVVFVRRQVFEIEKPERVYSEKQLIDFGSYLLSEQRFISIAETISEIPLTERFKQVHDADLKNFFEK